MRQQSLLHYSNPSLRSSQKFRPSIPNLVYQYNSYANFDGAEFLGQTNPEIDP